MTTDTDTDKAPEVAPLTLAELVALSTLASPGNGAMGAVASMVPLYALRSSQAIEQVWAMPAREAVAGIMVAIKGAFSEESFLRMRADIAFTTESIKLAMGAD